MAKLAVGDLDQRGLGAESNPEAGLLDHQLVIGAIADGEHVVRFEAELLAHLDKGVPLGHGIDDRVANLARQLAAGKHQAVGPHTIEPDRTSHRLGEGQEPTRHKETTRTARAHRLDERLRARRQMNALIEAALELALVEAGEQAHPLAKRTGEIKLAP